MLTDSHTISIPKLLYIYPVVSTSWSPSNPLPPPPPVPPHGACDSCTQSVAVKRDQEVEISMGPGQHQNSSGGDQ